MKCLQEEGLDGSLSYHPLISLSELFLVSFIAKFMTPSRGHQRGYTFCIPKCEEAEGTREGVVKKKDKQQIVGKGVRQNEGKKRDKEWRRDAEGCRSNA